jgi:hypothetical protein
MKAEIVKRVLLGLAIMVLIVIWSRNLLLLFPHEDRVTSNNTVVQEPKSSQKSQTKELSESDVAFNDDLRDPFQIPQTRPTQSDSTRKKSPPPPPPEPPHASLIGIVWNAKSPQAVVFDSLTNGSVILSERQSINGYQLRSISKTQVILQSKRQRVVWKANEQATK